MNIEIELGKNGIMPKKHYKTDLGYDLFTPKYIPIYPNEVYDLDLDIKIKPPYNIGAFIKERSSLARKGLHVIGGVIDNGYRGNIHVILVNTTYKSIYLNPGDAVAQLVLIPIFNFKLKKVNKLDKSDRNEKGFGSTNKRKI